MTEPPENPDDADPDPAFDPDSAPDTDADSDVDPDSEAAVDRVALADVDPEAFEALVADAAALVDDGVVALEDCSVGALLEAGEEPADGLVEAFEAAVRERVETCREQESSAPGDDRPGEEAGGPSGSRSGTQAGSETASGPTPATTDPAAVDWVHLWTESGVDPARPLSRTQLRLAVDVSKQTPIGEADADAFVDAAVDAGVLERDGARYRPAREDEDA